MTRTFLDDGSVLGQWWHKDPASDRVICDLCPRECHLKDGDRGFCFVRENRGGQMVLSTYGKSTGFCIDPIEKKPLNHFYPGTSVLSFGTAGCNLGCKFCQNWEISKSREVERLSQNATPEAIALAASELGMFWGNTQYRTDVAANVMVGLRVALTNRQAIGEADASLSICQRGRHVSNPKYRRRDRRL